MFEDIRRYIEATMEQLSPAKAQKLARQFLEPDARKEQVTKVAQELVDWSRTSRGRLRDFVAREVEHQLGAIGVAGTSDVDALKKRVRDLERAAGMTASGRKKASAAKPRAKAAPKRPGAAKKAGTAK